MMKIRRAPNASLSGVTIILHVKQKIVGDVDSCVTL